MRRAIFTLLLAAAAAVSWAQGSIEHVRRIHGWEDELHLASRDVLGDTWTCALGAAACNADVGSVNTVALSSGDSVICETTGGDWWSWGVDGAPAGLDTFNRLRVLPDGTVDSMPAVTASTCYRIGLGMSGAAALRLEDGAGVGSALALSPTEAMLGEDKTAGTPNTAGQLTLVSAGDNTYTTTVTTATQAQAVAYITPPDDGDANEVLTTNGSGTLTWEPVASGTAFTTQVTVDVDPGSNTVQELLELTNTDNTGDGSYGQKGRIRSEFLGSTDSGGSWASHDGAFIDFLKTTSSDYFTASGTADMDSGIGFGVRVDGADKTFGSAAYAMEIESDGEIKIGGGIANGGVEVAYATGGFYYNAKLIASSSWSYDAPADSMFFNQYYIGKEGSSADGNEMLGAYVSDMNAYDNSSDEVAVFAWSRGEAQTVATNGAGTPASFTLTPESFISLHRVTCNDADGCTATIAETYAWDGQSSQVCNVATYPITIADSSGVVELRGGESAVLRAYDCLGLVYSSDRYLEEFRSVAAGATSTYGITGQTQGVQHVKTHVTHTDIVTACGSNASCDLTVFTLPARSHVVGGYIIITEQGIATDVVTADLSHSGTGNIVLDGKDLKGAVGLVYFNDGDEFTGGSSFGGHFELAAYSIELGIACGAACNSITYSAGEYDIIVSYEVLP